MKVDTVAIVSCDIVGHSAATMATQVERVLAINKIVTGVIGSHGPGEVVWASGGDGGHVIFRHAAWRQSAVTLALTFGRWSVDQNVPLRTVCHRGVVSTIVGADGRIQPVGEGVNCAGWLLKYSTVTGVAVSDKFRRSMVQRLPFSDVEFHAPRQVFNPVFPVRSVFLMSGGDFTSSWVEASEEGSADVGVAEKRQAQSDPL